SVPDAKEYFKQKVAFLKANLEKLQETISQREGQFKVLMDVMQSKMDQAQAQQQRLYMVGSNQSEDSYRILKIDRTDTEEVNVTDDEIIYSKQEMMDLLAMIENGNKSAGGLAKVAPCFGTVGWSMPRHCSAHAYEQALFVFWKDIT
ncbi:phosphatidylinositol-3,5-bisphosphate 5-phosphatase, partial [Dinochytrium kinnereticum]